MICKNCSAEYDDAYVYCPECGEPNENEVLQEDEYVQENTDREQEISDEGGNQEEYYEAPVYRKVEASHKRRAEKGEREGNIRRRAATEASANKKTAKKGKTDLRATAIVIALCLVGLMSVLFTVVRVKTDAFKAEEKTQKAVAISNLSAEDEAALEKELSECYSALKLDFSSEGCDTESFVSRIDPSDKGNFYSVINSVSEQAQTVPDPAGRFMKEDGTYSYYKIEEAKVEKLLVRFGLSSDGAVNCKDYYYYDGFYYFNKDGMKATPAVSANITKSKRILDGGYYIECVFSVTDGSSTLKSGTYYVVAEKNEGNTDEAPFIIKRVDDEAIFGVSGDLKTQPGKVTYEMHEKVVEGKTKDGKLYCRYTFKYPVFEETTFGEQKINEFFAGTVSAYELRAASAQKNYDEFISKGGKAQELPFTEDVTVQVTYSDKDKISFVEKISTKSPEIPENQEETTQEDDGWGGYGDFGYGEEAQEEETVELPVKAYEAYTFDRNTGDFVEKDDCLGKNYVVISKVLYRIYNSSDYQDVIPEEIIGAGSEETTADAENPDGEDEDFGYDEYDEEYDEYGEEYGYDDGYGYGDDGYGFGEEYYEEETEDEEGLGSAIYESAGCFTENGFSFYYVEEEGYVTVVTIPWETVDILKELKSVTA